MTSELKTLDSGASWLYVLSWPQGGPDRKEAFVIPIFARASGVLLAVPLDFLPQEVLTVGLNAASMEVVGPSMVVQCPGMQETDTGEEVPVGIEISCLLVDFSDGILQNLREYDPVTDGDDIQHFWPELPETLPLSASLLEQALGSRVRHEDPFLLGCGGGSSQEVLCRAWCKEGSLEAEEGHNCFPGGATGDPGGKYHSHHFTAGGAQVQPGSFGRRGDSWPRNLKAFASDGFPSASCPGARRLEGLCKVGRATTEDPFEAVGSCAGSGRFPAFPTCSSWRSFKWRGDPCPDSAKSSYDGIGGPFDQPGLFHGPVIRKQFKFVNKGNSKARKAPAGARKSLRELHAAGGPISFQKDETDRCPSYGAQRLQEPLPLHQVLREAGWLSVPEGSGFVSMDAGSHSRLPFVRGSEGGPRASSPQHGRNRPGLSRWRQVGCGLPFEPFGGSSSRSFCSEGQVHQPPLGSFLSHMSPTLGDHDSILHQGDGLDCDAKIRSCRSRKKSSSNRGGQGQASSEEKTAEVPKEAQSRPGEQVALNDSKCMTFQGDLCSGTRSCQAPSSVAQPVDAKTSDGLSKGPKSLLEFAPVVFFCAVVFETPW